ncbi:putative uncharacterized protein [Prevotella sp. CAG:1092]|jgi:hypothetical protein|nr:putative uncharacterized protein [Prevotella sp. CAG:1092]
MTTTEELLKEYANIAGKNDAESEARKKEILSWLENHADEESIEKAKEFVNDKLNDIENDVAALNNN